MFSVLFLALIYPAPALASSSHCAFGRLIIPPLSDVLSMSVWIGTASPFHPLLHELILNSDASFMRTVKSRNNSPTVFVFLALSRGYWETEKEQIAKRMPSTQPQGYKWQEWNRHSQQPGATGFCWLFEGDGYPEEGRLPRELTIRVNQRAEQWGHAQGEDKAGQILQSGTAADPTTRPVRAVPKLGFGSAANEAGSFTTKHSSPLGWYSSAFISKARVWTLAARSHHSLLWLLCSNYATNYLRVSVRETTISFFTVGAAFSKFYLFIHSIKAGAQGSCASDKWEFGNCGHLCPYTLSRGRGKAGWYVCRDVWVCVPLRYVLSFHFLVTSLLLLCWC